MLHCNYTVRNKNIYLSVCLTSPSLQLDLEKFIKASGFANSHSARTNWNLVKKKVLTNANSFSKNKDEAGNNGSTDDSITVATPKSTKTPIKKTASANTGTKRKRQQLSAAIVDKDDDADDDEPAATPSKKAKKAGVKVEEFKEELDGSDEI